MVIEVDDAELGLANVKSKERQLNFETPSRNSENFKHYFIFKMLHNYFADDNQEELRRKQATIKCNLKHRRHFGKIN